MSRRLPVYLLIDTSGSMRGEPIAAANVGLRALISSQRQDAYALETVHVSVMTFDREVKVIVPLTPLDEFELPEIVTLESGPTLLGKALEALLARIDHEVRRTTADTKGDWPPILFIMTDGNPTDVGAYERLVVEMKRRRIGAIIACAAGSRTRLQDLEALTNQVFLLSTMDSNTFAGLFRWVSESVSTGNTIQSGLATSPLPAPPATIELPLSSFPD